MSSIDASFLLKNESPDQTNKRKVVEQKSPDKSEKLRQRVVELEKDNEKLLFDLKEQKLRFVYYQESSDTRIVNYKNQVYNLKELLLAEKKRTAPTSTTFACMNFRPHDSHEIIIDTTKKNKKKVMQEKVQFRSVGREDHGFKSEHKRPGPRLPSPTPAVQKKLSNV